MSVRIRLRRMGAKKRPFYRIVVADSRKPRGGRYIESLGHYNPMRDPPDVEIEEERLFGWLKDGARPSAPVRSLLSQLGLSRKWELLKRGEDVSHLEIPKLRAKIKREPPAPPSIVEKPEEPEVVEVKEETEGAEPEVVKEEAVAEKEKAVKEKKAASVEKRGGPEAKKQTKKVAAEAAGSKGRGKAGTKKTAAQKSSSAKADQKKPTKGTA